MTGSLQIKNDRYYMVLELGGKKQKWISTKLKVRGNKRREEDMLKAVIREYEEKALQVPKEDITIFELIKKYLVSKKGTIRPNSYTSYMDTATKHVLPYFQETDLTVQNLEPFHVKQYYTNKFQEGLSYESLTRHRTILCGSIDYAIETLGMLNVNVADRVKLPRKAVQRTPTYYDEKQLKKLFIEVAGESIEAPVRLSATYGLRRSEVLGLQWEAVDFKKKTIRIQHTVVRDGKSVIRDDTVKETASFRTMPLTRDMEEYLKKLHAHQKQMKKDCGKAYDDNDYICKWDDGHLLDPAYVSSRFKRFLKSKGLDHIRFHDLRHSSATLLISNGFKLEQVKEWLGHASIRSTERYAHFQSDNKQELADKVNTLLSL